MLRRLLPRAAAGPSWMAALRPPHSQSSQLMLVATRGARTNRQAGGHGTRNGGGKGGKGKSRRQAVPALVTVPELCTADRLARELRLSFEELVAKAEGLGEEISGPSQPLDTELLELLAIEAGAEGINVLAVDLGRRPMPSAEERAKLPLRPPVVTLMGHVDHGKTSMLDAFRGSSIAAGEAGGITQSISAFTVDAGTPSAITFIDTPGHELFAAMRQRGAHATDLVVLVVAVDAGVQPTTVQAIEYARGTSAPLVVAINKMDRDGAEREYPKVVDQLLAQGVVPEDMGGEVPFVRVSAKTGLNLDELRDTLLLQAELLELHAEDGGPAEGVVLEASLQKGLGIVTSLLVQRGCLMPNDYVVAGASWGKAKVLLSAEGNQRLKRAPPSTPVRLAGLKELPRTGDDVYVVASEAKAKEAVEYYAARQHLARVAVLEGERQLELDVRLEAQRKKAELEVAEGRTPWFIKKAQARHQLREQRQAEARDAAIARRMDLGPQVTTEIGAPNLVPVLLKADSAGSLEAVHESLRHFPTDRVQLQIVKSDLGTVTEGDVTLAESLGATIVGFNVSAPSKVAQQAEKAEVAVHTHRVIYELTDAVKAVLEEAIEPVWEEKELGQTEVLQLFTLTLNRKDRREGMKKLTGVVGCRVVAGEALANAKVRVERGEEGSALQTVHEGKAISLKSFKNEVKSVRKGQECGVILENSPEDIQPGDRLTFYDIVPRRPGLYEAIEGLGGSTAEANATQSSES